ncbi:MAG: putative Ig domain-containing protein [Lentimicrobiaceae bacterium]|nr:putative Ig domain-containing protein [Lentimicrobiaceae bacterium]
MTKKLSLFFIMAVLMATNTSYAQNFHNLVKKQMTTSIITASDVVHPKSPLDNTILQQGFEGTTGNNLPTGWTRSTTATGVWNYETGGIDPTVPVGWLATSNLLDHGTSIGIPAHGGTRYVGLVTYVQYPTCNAWLFSSSMSLTAGTTYTLKFWAVVYGYADENEYDYLKVHVGTSNTATGMASAPVLYNNTNNRLTDWTQITQTFTVPTTGTYYLGFNAYTPVTEGFFITLDDIEVTSSSGGGDFTGSGTESDPYMITTAAGLAQLATYVNTNTAPYANAGVHYKLGNDISLSAYQTGAGWIPIGNNQAFKGNFDGNNKKITNLKIDNTSLQYVGLFGSINNSTVKNLGIENVNITSTITTSTNNVGGIIGQNSNGSISNCYSSGTVSSSSISYSSYDVNTGGIVGLNSGGSIINSHSACSLSSTSSASSANMVVVGGIVGNNMGGNVSNCYSTGSVNSNSTVPTSVAGGVVGWNQNSGSISSTVQYCYSTGLIKSNSTNGSTYTGGVVGANVNNSTVSNCYSTGAITSNASGTSYASGVAGVNQGSVSNCAALNSSISCTGTYLYCGRVVGYLLGSNTILSNNIAFDNMLNPDGQPNWNNPGLDQHNGADITTVAIHADGTLGGRFTSANGWTTQNGKLPGFGTAVNMPAHLAIFAPTITTTSLPNGTVGAPYSEKLTATGSTPMTWTVQSGNLPNGITLAENGKISGIPTESGNFNITFKATNSAGTHTKALSIIINASPNAPVITTTTLPDGLVGTMYPATVISATGIGPITWVVTSGNLPNGITLSEYGVLMGTPTAAGTFNFTVKATNSYGTDTKALSIKITTTAEPPKITTATLPNGKVGVIYNQALSASGTAPITWGMTNGALPTGLTLFETGAITGTPTTAGTFNFTVKATNSVGSDTKSLTIKIEDGVGVSENEMEEMRVYPNPTTGELQVTSNEQKRTNIQIFDLMGKMILEQTSQLSPITTIDISHLSNGIYILKMDNRFVKIIKQ